MRLNRDEYNFTDWEQPIFSSNDTWGTVSSINESMPAWNALDGNLNTQWETTKLTSADPIDFVWNFESPLLISQITLTNKKSGGVYVTKSVKIYADLDKTDLIVSGEFELVGQSSLILSADACTDCIVFECYSNDGYASNMYVGFSEILVSAKLGEEKIYIDGIDTYLNTTEGMEVVVNNTKHDDDSVTVSGVDWFNFDGATVANIYANGNSWIGIGKNSEQMKVCRRDGAMWYLYRQEGTLYNYYKFLKIRWEGYSAYNSATSEYAIKYELFLISNGDMFLNVIQTPASSSYVGVSSLASGGVTTTLNIPANLAPAITFTHKDDTGLLWDIAYEKINIIPPYDRKYLVKSGDAYYKAIGTVLEEVQITDLNAQAFKDFGTDIRPESVALLTATNPKILYWQDTQDALPQKMAAVQAIPHTQTLYTTEQDLKDPSIVGIDSIKIDASEDAKFAFSSDRGSFRVYSTETGAWVDAAEDEGVTKAEVEAVTAEQWGLLIGKEVYQVRFLLPENSYLNEIVVTYKNEGGIKT